MKISTRGRYAIMAMVELARLNQAGERSPVKLVQISQAQDISVQYLEQIFADLRRFGLVESVRGKYGGYKLLSAPNELFLSQIIDAVDEAVDVTRCKSGAGCSIKSGRCMTHDLWSQLSTHIRGFFDAVSLQDVVRGDVTTMFMENSEASDLNAIQVRPL